MKDLTAVTFITIYQPLETQPCCMAEKESKSVCICVYVCVYVGEVVIKIGLIIRAVMESHTLWTPNSLLLFLLKSCIVQCWSYSEWECLYHAYVCVSIHIMRMLLGTLVVERGAWWMNCPALWKHARFPPPRHRKRMALSPPFWTALLLSKTNGRTPLPPTSPPLCGWQVAALLAFAIGTSCLSPLLLWATYLDYPKLCLLPPSPAQHPRMNKKKINRLCICLCMHKHMCVCVCEGWRAYVIPLGCMFHIFHQQILN